MSCSSIDSPASARIQRLRNRLKDMGLAAFFVRNQSNVAWLTAFDGYFDEEDAHALYVGAEAQDAVLHTDSRYSTAARALSEGLPITVDDNAYSHPAFAARLFEQQRSDSPAKGTRFRLGIESTMMLGEFRQLQKDMNKVGADDCLEETNMTIVALRGVKDEAEVTRLRAAQAITDAAFDHIVDFMHEGMTERQIQIELEDFMRRQGASGLAFTSIVATGPNGAKPHSVPGETVLEQGQCVVMDFGARASGYCSDMTRTVFIGNPSEKLKRAYEVLRRANEECEALIAPGVLSCDVHNHAEAVLDEGGFGGSMGHALGHGVGIDIHELPVLAPRNDKPLEVGNVITVEPGIYIPGEFGMRLEDFGVVTDNGYQVFTQSTHDMVII